MFICTYIYIYLHTIYIYTYTYHDVSSVNSSYPPSCLYFRSKGQTQVRSVFRYVCKNSTPSNTHTHTYTSIGLGCLDDPGHLDAWPVSISKAAGLWSKTTSTCGQNHPKSTIVPLMAPIILPNFNQLPTPGTTMKQSIPWSPFDFEQS